MVLRAVSSAQPNQVDRRIRCASAFAFALISILAIGCGAVHINQSSSSTSVWVTVSPSSVNIAAGNQQQFTATINGSGNIGVLWTVNGIQGGSATIGTITTTGLYTAPNIPPKNSAVTIGAISSANPNEGASAVLTIRDLVQVSPSSADVAVGDQIQLLALVNEQQSSAVIWSVDGVLGGNAEVGTVSGSGAYRAPAAPLSYPIQITATEAANSSASGTASLTVFDPTIRRFHREWLSGVAAVAESYGCTDIQIQQQESESLVDAVARFGANSGEGSCLVLWPISTDSMKLRYSLSWGGTISGKDILYISDVNLPRIWNAEPMNVGGGIN